MSTDVQLKGDSRRRQLEKSEAYAKAHGLELAPEDQLEDIGISAFKGDNLKEGALGRFLEVVEKGLVPKGSYLLVESLDRLSRQKINISLALFLRIIDAGINLVTLADNHVYRAGEPDLQDLIVSLVSMSRAHEESAVKSQRLGAAWKNKRAMASEGRPMTKWAPAWLRLSSDRTRFEVIPDRIEIVQRIFNEAASGIGMYVIARRLNSSNVPTFSRSNGWHQSYISKILSNRAVLGEFQPGTRKDGVRVAEGEAIKNYYPAIIDEKLFFQAQYGRDQRKIKTAAGRKGQAFANLFSGLATCAYCGEKVLYENKGSGPKGGSYLVCDGARRKLGCEALRWRYKDFEASFLAFVQEIDLASILCSAEDSQKRALLEKEVAAIKGELSSTMKLMEQTYILLSTTGSMEFVSLKLKELDSKRTALTQELVAKEAEKLAFDAKEERFHTSRDEIKTLVAQLQELPTAELYKQRAQIASRLRTLVTTLLVAPQGEAPKMRKTIATLHELEDRPGDDVMELMSSLANKTDQSRPYFAVGFNDAAVRIVHPLKDDPLGYEMQIEAGAGIITIGNPREWRLMH
jgi:DNA invertase Pin-like site-specific DNA recombinase